MVTEARTERWVLLRSVTLVQTLVLALVPPGASGNWVAQVVWLAYVAVLFLALPRNTHDRYKGIVGASVLAVLLLSIQVVTAPLAAGATSYTVRALGLSFALSANGLASGVVLASKVLAVFGSARVLSGASVGALSALLSALHAPRVFADGLLLARRALIVVEAQWSHVREAQTLRGVDVSRRRFGQGLFRVYPKLVVPLFLSLMRRNLQLEMSLVMRGFYAPVRRTSLYVMSTTKMEWCLVALSTIAWLLCVTQNSSRLII